MSTTAVMNPIVTENIGFNQAMAAAAAAPEEQALQHVQRTNKPRPLKLEQPGQGFNFNQPVTLMNADELLDLMHKINNGVKSGQFTSQLAQQIFRLYQQLKNFGDRIEQQHKNELNRVFVSLRQACCRDSGQLGTPCRLKIMELVELRAMGWKPNLAHSQYYLNRTSNSQNDSSGQSQAMNGQPTVHQAVSTHMQMSHQQGIHGVDQFDQSIMAAAPISAPPFGTMPMNPFAFGPPAQHHHQQQALVQHHVTSHPNEIALPTMTTQPTVSQTAPSYYLIPASGTMFSHPGPPMGMMPPPSPLQAPPMGFALPPPVQQMQQTPPQVVSAYQQPITTNYQPISTAMTASGGMDQQGSPPEIETPWPRGAVVKPSPKFPAPQKVAGKNMFRDEIIIRNADSGKIMGVKGRRVAVVEEISKTIISFQKVAQGAKERTLTITGNTEETIEHAKRLIEETIKRNVSPAREGEEETTELSTGVEAALPIPAGSVQQLIEAGSEGLAEIQNEIADATKKDANRNFFELTNDAGVLKLSCADPEMLAAAQDALNAYFKRMTPLRRSQGSQMTPAERQQKSERRKSMPTYSPDKNKKGPEVCPPEEVLSWRRRENSNKEPEDIEPSARGGSDSPKAQSKNVKGISNRPLQKKNAPQGFAKSTPNLAIEDNGRENNDSASKTEVGMRVLYTRDYLLNCSQSPLSQLSPDALEHMQQEAPEILREAPGKFDVAAYKEQRSAALKRQQQSA